MAIAPEKMVNVRLKDGGTVRFKMGEYNAEMHQYLRKYARPESFQKFNTDRGQTGGATGTYETRPWKKDWWKERGEHLVNLEGKTPAEKAKHAAVRTGAGMAESVENLFFGSAKLAAHALPASLEKPIQESYDEDRARNTARMSAIQEAHGGRDIYSGIGAFVPDALAIGKVAKPLQAIRALRSVAGEGAKGLAKNVGKAYVRGAATGAAFETAKTGEPMEGLRQAPYWGLFEAGGTLAGAAARPVVGALRGKGRVAPGALRGKGRVAPENAGELNIERAELKPAETMLMHGGPELGAKKFVENEVKQVVDKVVAAWNDIMDAFSPAGRGGGAGRMARIIRAKSGELARKKEVAFESMKNLSRAFGKMSKEQNRDFIFRIQKGKSQTTPELDKAAVLLKELLEPRRASVEIYKPEMAEVWFDNYFPGLWKKTKNNQEILGQIFGKKPLEGSKSFLKHKTVGDIYEGLMRGLEPVTENAIDMVLLKSHEMDRYVFGQEILKEMKETGLARFVRFGENTPDGWEKINDKIATKYVPVNKYGHYVEESVVNESKSETTKILKEKITEAIRSGEGDGPIKSNGTVKVENQVREALLARGRTEGEAENIISMVRKAPAGGLREKLIEREIENTINRITETRTTKEWVSGKGFVKVGEYYAPAGAARVINNYLSPGLRGNNVYEMFRMGGNSMNQAQLGLSAFHLTFTALDSTISQVALAEQQLSRGKLLQGLGGIAKGLIPLQAPISTFLKGNKVIEEYLKPGTHGGTAAEAVDQLIKAGGRVRMDVIYKNNSVEAFHKALREGNIPGAVLRSPFAIVEYASKPIMEYLVPRMKLGVFFDLAKFELEKAGKDATPDMERKLLARAWDSVDNRMGQMVYDNLFWNKTLKDLGLISVRSLGWNLGTFREIGGGVLVDLPTQLKSAVKRQGFEMTPRMAYAVALPAVVGLYGAALQYLMTGKGPDELKDYFFPKTGELDKRGVPERVALASYMKDVYAYAEAPGTTLSHKVHPAINTVIEMLRNKDFYGNEIRHEGDPIVRQAIDEVAHLGKQAIPFSFRNYQQAKQTGESTGKAAMSFFGVTPAPKSISQTPAEKKMFEILRGNMPSRARTQEEAARSREVARLRNMYLGKRLDNSEITKAVKEGKIRITDVAKIRERIPKNKFIATTKSFTLPQVIEIYEKANDKEKKMLKPIILKKYANTIGNYSTAERESLRDTVHKIRKEAMKEK